LLRSSSDGKVYDSIPEVCQRYLGNRQKRKVVEVWKPDRHVRFIRRHSLLRVQGNEAFRLRWSGDNWQSQSDTESTVNALEINFVDLPVSVTSSKDVCMKFTFFWPGRNQWEGSDYAVTVQ